MTWEEVDVGLVAAKNAGVRPRSSAIPVYESAYNVTVKKRLVGRGITLLGHVKSIISGRNDFQCSNGNQWRTRPKLVMDGEGCSECGMGTRTPEEMDEIINAGYICLLTNPSKPGFISVGVKRGSLDHIAKDYPWGDWEIHRYRHVEEIDLAESLIWELLGKPLPDDREPIQMELKEAEEAIRA
jgi:hypothetical protein